MTYTQSLHSAASSLQTSVLHVYNDANDYISIRSKTSKIRQNFRRQHSSTATVNSTAEVSCLWILNNEHRRDRLTDRQTDRLSHLLLMQHASFKYKRYTIKTNLGKISNVLQFPRFKTTTTTRTTTTGVWCVNAGRPSDINNQSASPTLNDRDKTSGVTLTLSSIGPVSYIRISLCYFCFRWQGICCL